MLLHQRANHMPTRHNNRRKSICVSRPLSMKQSAKIKYAQLKRFSPEHNLPTTEKNSSEQAAFWHEVKSRVLPSDSPFILKIHVLFLYS